MKPADKMGRGKLCKRCKSTYLIGPEGNICPTCSVRFCSLCHGGVYHIDPVTKIESKNCSSCGDSSSEDEEFVRTKKTSLMSSHAPPTHQYPTRSQRHQETLAKSQSRKPCQVASKDDTRLGDSKQNPPKIGRSSPLNRKSGNSSKREVDTVILTGKKRSRPMSSVSSDDELENHPEPNYLLASENKPKGLTKIVEEPAKRRSVGYEKIQIKYQNDTAN